MMEIVGSITLFLFGQLSFMHYMLLFFLVVEWLTEIFVEMIKGKLSTSMLRIKLIRKLFIITMVAVSNMLDIVLQTEHCLQYGTIVFYLMNEFLGIVHNANRAGLPIPQFMIRLCEIFRKRTKDTH